MPSLAKERIGGRFEGVVMRRAPEPTEPRGSEQTGTVWSLLPGIIRLRFQPRAHTDEPKERNMRIEIKNRWTDAVLYTAEVLDGTESGMTMRLALEQAVTLDANQNERT